MIISSIKLQIELEVKKGAELFMVIILILFLMAVAVFLEWQVAGLTISIEKKILKLCFYQ